MFSTQSKYKDKRFKVKKNSINFIVLILFWPHRSIKLPIYISEYIDLKRKHVDWSVLKHIVSLKIITETTTDFM